MGVEDIVDEIVPPGIDKTTRWRLMVSLSIVGFALYICWSVGAFAFVGLEGFARAGDISKVDTRVVAVDNRMAALEANQRTGLRITLGAEICRLHWLRMDATGDMWLQLNNSFNGRQEEYAAINNGYHYSVAECSKPK